METLPHGVIFARMPDGEIGLVINLGELPEHFLITIIGPDDPKTGDRSPAWVFHPGALNRAINLGARQGRVVPNIPGPDRPKGSGRHRPRS